MKTAWTLVAILTIALCFLPFIDRIRYGNWNRASWVLWTVCVIVLGQALIALNF